MILKLWVADTNSWRIYDHVHDLQFSDAAVPAGSIAENADYLIRLHDPDTPPLIRWFRWEHQDDSYLLVTDRYPIYLLSDTGETLEVIS